MKRIIFLLMICASMYAQNLDMKIVGDSVFYYQDGKLTSKGLWGSIMSPATTAYYSPRWLVEFVDYWQSYKKECYADSTLIEFDVYLDRRGNKHYSPHNMNAIDLWANSAYRGIEKIWTHKNPNDLAEFMNWLERRVK